MTSSPRVVFSRPHNAASPRRIFRTLGALVTISLALAACGQAKVAEPASPPPVLRVVGFQQSPTEPSLLSDRYDHKQQWTLKPGTGTTRSSLPAFVYDANAISVDQVSELATALGLRTPPLRHAHGWLVNDGPATLKVHESGAWEFESDPLACAINQVDIESESGAGHGCALPQGSSTVPCSGPDPETQVSSGSDASSEPTGAMGCMHVICPICTVPPADPVPPSAAQAMDTASRFFTSIHLVGTQFAPNWAPNLPNATDVALSPTVAGLPTAGLLNVVSINSAGIYVGSGRIGVPTSLGDYPLISASDALTTLNNSPDGNPLEMCPDDPSHPCNPAVENVLTSATLALSAQSDGSRTLLIPSWLYAKHDQHNPAEAVLSSAVAPAFIDQSTASEAPSPSVLPSTSS